MNGKLKIVEIAAIKESARVQRVHQLPLLDTSIESYVRNLVELARQVAGTPYGAVTILDENQQWIRYTAGLAPMKTPRSWAFCNETILLPANVPFIVEDTRLHQLYQTHPLVVGAPFIRSYLGLPLITADGHALGALCVIDSKPRQFLASELTGLQEVADFIIDAIE